VDGCFWHGCLKHCRMPSTNRKYWNQKIARNVQRDVAVNRELRRNGWTTIRFWEHELCGGTGLTRKLKRLKGIVQQDKSSVRCKPRR
jgi:DNA mismatch endonuclease (patch repair protein)